MQIEINTYVFVNYPIYNTMQLWKKISWKKRREDGLVLLCLLSFPPLRYPLNLELTSFFLKQISFKKAPSGRMAAANGSGSIPNPTRRANRGGILPCAPQWVDSLQRPQPSQSWRCTQGCPSKSFIWYCFALFCQWSSSWSDFVHYFKR